MARTTKSKSQLESELAAVESTLATLSATQSGLLDRVAARGPVSTQVMVGIRNVSDNTIGIPGKFGEPDIHLHADLGDQDPASVAIISFAWWRELRKSKYVAQGQIVRDDSILGGAYLTAPADRPEELPKDAARHIVLDPVEWVESRTETQIREDLAQITYEPTLQRIRRAVDLKLKELEAQYPGDERAVAKAMSALSMKYKLVDELTTIAIEKPEEVIDIPSKMTITKNGLKEL